MRERVRYSINLQEDFDIYGVDPNEDFNDWSFLDVKPDSIIEKSEEEKELLAQLSEPSISDKEIEDEIFSKLRNLLQETDTLIGDRPRTPAQEVPEAKAPNKVNEIIQQLLDTTQRVDDVAELTDDLMKSDLISIEDIQVPEEVTKKSLELLLPPQKPEPDKEEGLLSRYSKPPTTAKIIRELDETERLESKIAMERKKREEDMEKELQDMEKAIEEKNKKFLESIEEEVEKNKKEAQLVEAIKSAKPISTADMLNKIHRSEPAKPPPRPQKAKPPPKGELYTQDQINQFQQQLDQMKRMEHPQTLIVKRLQSKKPPKTKVHFSKTFESSILKILTQLLLPFLKKKSLQTSKLRSFLKLWNTRLQERLYTKQRASQTIKRFWRKHQARLQQQKEEERRRKAEEEEYQRRRKEQEEAANLRIRERLRMIEEFNFQREDALDRWADSDVQQTDAFDSFLDEIEDDQPRHPSSDPNPAIIAEGKSVPIEDGVDDILKEFGQEIHIEDDPTNVDVPLKIDDDPRRKKSEGKRETVEQFQERAEREGFKFTPEQSEKIMTKLAEAPESPPPKKEKPVDRFLRRYGGRVSESNESPKKTNKMHFRQNNTRTRRLQNIQKAWFEGERKNQEGQQQEP